MSIQSLLAKIRVIKILPNIQENCCVGVTPNWLIWLSQVHPLPQACWKIFITHGQASYCQLVPTQHVVPSHFSHVRGCWSTEQDHPGSVNKDYWKKTWSRSRVRTQYKSNLTLIPVIAGNHFDVAYSSPIPRTQILENPSYCPWVHWWYSMLPGLPQIVLVETSPDTTSSVTPL